MRIVWEDVMLVVGLCLVVIWLGYDCYVVYNLNEKLGVVESKIDEFGSKIGGKIDAINSQLTTEFALTRQQIRDDTQKFLDLAR